MTGLTGVESCHLFAYLTKEYDFHEEALDRICSHPCLFLRGPWLDRDAHLSRDAPHPRSCRYHFRTSGCYFRPDGPGSECLAIHGRNGNRLHLGPWQLRRAGLDCRLAASRIGICFERVVQHPVWETLCAAIGRATSRVAWSPARVLQTQHLRRDDGRHRDRPDSGSCI